MQVDDLVFEVRDRSLNRVGVIVTQDLVGATLVVRFNSTGTWALKLPYDHPLGELLRLPGYGLVVTGPTSETIISKICLPHVYSSVVRIIPILPN